MFIIHNPYSKVNFFCHGNKMTLSIAFVRRQLMHKINILLNRKVPAILARAFLLLTVKIKNFGFHFLVFFQKAQHPHESSQFVLLSVNFHLLLNTHIMHKKYIHHVFR